MRSVYFIEEAEEEFNDIIEYYEDKCSGLGLDFYIEIKEAILQIASFPECSPEMDDNTRRFLLNRFPYLIIYYLHNQDIWIIAISHFKRKPRYWRNRMGDQDNVK